jgi:multimeric flavodoxin WrbA
MVSIGVADSLAGRLFLDPGRGAAGSATLSSWVGRGLGTHEPVRIRPGSQAFAMKTLLIVFHSLTGGTRQMAEAAARGAGAQVDVRVHLLPAAQAQPADVLAADGYIFAAPETLASMSGMMKDFFDRTYYAALERINGRPYAVLICAGSDGQNAARQIERIATGWRLRAVADPIVVCTHAQTPEAIFAQKAIPPKDLARCEELGAALAAGLALGIF